MQKIYYKAAEGNFGDDLNKWIWDEVLPGTWDSSSNLYFLGIGTILSPWLPQHRDWVICGSGTGYGRPSIDVHDPRTYIAAVRGPMTAKVLGLPAHKAVTDGAILLATLPRFRSLPPQERRGIVFVPHKSAFAAGNWNLACEMAGVTLVDPRTDCEQVIQHIRHASLVLADSMHAGIVADTLRVPWVAVSTSPEVNQFKWLDWALSMNVPYGPIALPASTAAEWWRSRFIAANSPRVDSEGQVDRAIEIYEAGDLRRRKPGRLAERLLNRWPRKAARLTNALIGSDKPFAKRAAAALRDAASRPGILSDPILFAQKLDRFRSCLVEVREKANAFERGG